MDDPREQIMARLAALAGALAGIANLFRNEIVTDETMLPAICLMEGDEEADDADPAGRPQTAPRRVTMQPQLVIAAGGEAAALGPALNAWRAALIKAVLTDATLAALSHQGRGVRYDGMATDLGLGRTQEGQMALMFSITYMLRPLDL